MKIPLPKISNIQKITCIFIMYVFLLFVYVKQDRYSSQENDLSSFSRLVPVRKKEPRPLHSISRNLFFNESSSKETEENISSATPLLPKTTDLKLPKIPPSASLKLSQITPSASPFYRNRPDVILPIIPPSATLLHPKTTDLKLSNISPSASLKFSQIIPYLHPKTPYLKLSPITPSASTLYPKTFNGKDPYVWEQIPPRVRMECLKDLPNVDVNSTFDDDARFLSTPEGASYKKILVWNTAYEDLIMGFGLGHKPFENGCCLEQRCSITTNRTKFPLEEFDAIIFHFRGLKVKDLPKRRSEHQRWIFFEAESPAYSYQSVSQYNKIFNWTMTYRRDADVYSGYAYVFPRKMIGAGSKKRTKNIDKIGNGLVAMISHCGTLSSRRKIIDYLKIYMEVDVYGKCGDFECPRSENDLCYKMVEKHYKFYLSFENSLCKDYITEKLFNILRYDIIPIVYGWGDYKAVAPPHSYINVEDFSTIEQLVEYLNYLQHNDTAYNEYFKWKEDFNVITHTWMVSALRFCNLCQRLHSDVAPKVYSDLEHWFVTKAECPRKLKLYI